MRIQSQTFPPQSQASVLWLGVGALAAVYGSFTLSWVIYRVHLASLLAPFGFSAQFAAQLLWVEALLAIALEPLMGSLSDRLESRQSRLSLISVGVLLSSALLIAVPAWVTFVTPTGAGRWWLPGLLVAWAIAMSVFRSPALALLARCATPARLPIAASPLTLALGLAGAAAPLGKPVILSLGAPLTFTVAAFLLLGAATLLRRFAPAAAPAAEPPRSPVNGLWLSLMFVTGLGVTLAFRLAIELFPKILEARLPQLSAPPLVGAIFLALAFAAVPAGLLAARLGNRRAMLLGLVGMAVFLALMPLVQSAAVAWVAAVGVGSSASLVTNGTLPLVLDPADRPGLSVGALFGGAAAATSLFMGVLSQPQLIAPLPGIGVAIGALLAAGLAVAASGGRRAPA